MQAEVDRRFREYQNISRGDSQGKPNTALKSDRFRSGVSKVKVPISWPQDYCSVLVGQKQPTYDELSLEQWFQGLLYCILEQDSNVIRENMLYYLTLLMQDAVELSSSTARRAHAAVLQEVDWSKMEQIEKIRNRYTQRVVQQSKSNTGPSIQMQVCSHYNKGYCRYESEHMVGNVLYQHYCSFCMRETHKKIDHLSIKCLRAKNQSTNAKSEVTKPKQNERVFNNINYLSMCETYVFSQTQSGSDINDKKFIPIFYSYSTTCHTVLGNSIDALSWHVNDKNYCYAVALPFSVSFLRESDPYNWALIGTKCNEYHEVRTCNYGALKTNTWSGDKMNSYDGKSVTGANSFTNLCALYSPEYVPSLCQVGARSSDTNLLDLASNLVFTNTGQFEF